MVGKHAASSLTTTARTIRKAREVTRVRKFDQSTYDRRWIGVADPIFKRSYLGEYFELCVQVGCGERTRS